MLPPALPGHPLLGNMREFRRDPVACIRRAYGELGPVFMLRLGPKRVAVMIGPHYHRLFNKETDKSLTTQEVYRFLTPMFGEVLGACPFAEYKEQKRAIAPFFSKASTAAHVGVMAEEAQRLCERLGQLGEFDLWETVEHTALTIAARAMLGADFWALPNVDFHALFHAIARGMDYILPPNLPLPRFLRRNRARRRLYALMTPLVEARRRGAARDDLFQRLATATYANGRLLPVETAVGLTLIMIHGAYETVAAQTAWCLLDIIAHPTVLRGLRNECAAAWPAGTPISAETLARMPKLAAAVNESARLHPAATVVCRQAARAFRAGPYTIPAGSLVMICPGAAHRLPEVFADPDEFVADRFLAADFDPSEYITFGGGLHGCLGYDFAIAEIMVVTATLFSRYELALVGENPLPNYDICVTRPAPPCSISFRRRAAVDVPRSPVATAS